MVKILLVEDDNNLREIFEMRLQADGFETLTASNGEEALVTAMKEKPDLIVADVMMPKMSGFEMLESLRQTPEMKDIKVVMMTALGQAEDQARGEKLGVVKYLVKSQVTLEDFARVISEVVKGSPVLSSSITGSAAPADTNSSTNNNTNLESEKSMPEDTTPTNPTPSTPMPDANAAPASNPISDASAALSGSAQPSTAQEQSTVTNQINDFAAAPSAPAVDPSASAAPDPFASAPSAPADPVPSAPDTSSSIPVSEPPTADPAAPAPDASAPSAPADPMAPPASPAGL